MSRTLATVPPAEFGTNQWVEWRTPLLDVAAKRLPDASEQARIQWADEYLWAHSDVADLRALGFCATCGHPITLRQVGRCVYSEPCGHYRAHGELQRIRNYLGLALRKMSPERRAAVLHLIGRENV